MGYEPAVSPQLAVRRGREAIEFYKAAFGARELYRVGGTDEDEEVVAQLAVGGGAFWVADEAPASKNFSPESLGGSTVKLLLIDDDPQAVVERAIGLGATVVYPVELSTAGCWAASKTRSATTGRSASPWWTGPRLPDPELQLDRGDARRRVAVPGGRARGHRVIERLEVVGAEGDLGRLRVLLDVGGVLGARDRHDVVALVQEPGERELAGRAADVLRRSSPTRSTSSRLRSRFSAWKRGW